MAAETSIEWCDATFNPWIGCTKVSPACDHCYAEADMDLRRHRVKWGAGHPRSRTSAANWTQLERWNARPFWTCEACRWRGEGDSSYCPGCESGVLVPARRRIFCASLADVFDNEVDPQWRADLFDLIARTPNLDWLLLTKRIGNVHAMVPGTWRPLYPRNVWIGATIANQAEASRDIPKLLKLPAHVRFLSIEPLLGPVDLCETLGIWWNQTMGCFEGTTSRMNPKGLDWVIAGGESGTQARAMHPDWVRSLRDQCAAAGVPFLFKQWGEWGPAIANHGVRVALGGLARVGKKRAGRSLDGVEHNGFPEDPRATEFANAAMAAGPCPACGEAGVCKCTGDHR